MFLYPGGTSTDKDTQGYSFFENFFSDLGMFNTYNGDPNLLSFLLFSFSLILVGIALIVFFIIMSDFFSNTKLEKIVSKISSVIGILTGISCIGIASTPWDLFYNLHMIFVWCFSVSFLLVVLFLSVAIFKNKNYSNLYAYIFIIYIIILLIYFVFLSSGVDIETKRGLLIMATGQKIIIYLGMICLFIQLFGAFIYNREYCNI